MEPRTLGALLLLMLHLLQSRADRESNVPVQRDVRTPPDELLGTGMAASLAAILGLIQASLTSGLPESSRPQPDVGGGGGLLSLSNQVRGFVPFLHRRIDRSTGGSLARNCKPGTTLSA
ncbi:hypothetical protein V5799_032915 [Amblyomma americanum]|uniref:Secreted protein n=1 Tax=Amblyomma americanum TaxID=6943 RepID=A0AAQ4DQ42_AMBAM